MSCCKGEPSNEWSLSWGTRFTSLRCSLWGKATVVPYDWKWFLQQRCPKSFTALLSSSHYCYYWFLRFSIFDYFVILQFLYFFPYDFKWQHLTADPCPSFGMEKRITHLLKLLISQQTNKGDYKQKRCTLTSLQKKKSLFSIWAHGKETLCNSFWVYYSIPNRSQSQASIQTQD